MERYKMWIGGNWVDANSGRTFAILNPSTEEELGQVPLGAKDDADRAVEAAVEAFPVWSKMLQSDRSKIIQRIAAGIREHADELVSLEVREHGTPAQFARMFVAGAAESAEYAASISRALMGQVLPTALPNTVSYLQRVPIGVCALITPWNVPLGMMVSMLAPALAVGNTCVLKPASVNSLLGIKFAEILAKAGMPAGVANLVTGPGSSLGETLASHPGVDLVRLTGGTDTGKAAMAAASPTVKKVIMELGGNNPVIVCEDADVQTAASLQAQRHFLNSAQNCSTPGRYYVHEKVYDQFVATYVNEVKKIVVGDPWDEKTTMGPMANRQQRDRVEYYIKSAVEEGARIALGGHRPTTPPLDKGYYLMPTVVVDVTHDMTIAREEIFGPAAPILKFSSEEEVVKLANDSTYGLCAVVWTKNIGKALKFVNELCVDSVFVNTPRMMAPEFPWGGNVKESGVGKDGSMCGMEELTELKLVCIAHA